MQDFPRELIDDGSGSESETSRPKRRKLLGGGIDALVVDYADQKDHVDKAKGIVEFEMEGECALCHEELEHDAGIYTICPTPGCDSVTHMMCLSKHLLKGDKDSIIPVQGHCPSCKSELKWVDVVKETTLRMRGEKEITKLLKPKRVKKVKGVTASQAAATLSEDEDDEADAEMEQEMAELRELDGAPKGSQMGDSWNAVSDSESETGSIASVASGTAKASSFRTRKVGVSKTIIEDSDWDDAIEL